MIICQLYIYGEEVSNRNTIIAFAQNTSHYLSLPEYWSSRNTEHHPALKCREFSMILMFPVTEVTSDFQRFHTNSMVSLPTELEIDSQQSLKEWYHCLSDYEEDLDLFLGLAVDCYICQLSFTMHKNMATHFHLPPYISLWTRNKEIPSAWPTFHRLPLLFLTLSLQVTVFV